MTFLDRHRKEAAGLALIFAAVFAAFFNSLSNAFVWDDVYLVVKNPLTLGWDRLPEIFTSGYWYALGKTGGLYRPLTILSFLAERSVAGLDPFLYHLDNVLLHAVCSALVFFIMKKILPGGPAPLFAALVFAVHPVHSEAVAWVSGRAELLSAVFLLGSFLIFLKSSGWPARYAAAPLLFLLGLLSKETAAVLPAIIFLYILLIKREREAAAVLRELAPFLMVLALYLPLRLAVLKGGATPPEGVLQDLENLPAFLVMGKAVFYYLRLTLFPTDMRFLYLFPPPSSVFSLETIFPLAAAAMAVVLAVSQKTRYYGFFLLFFFFALLPVSNIMPTEILLSERALYLPSFGLCAVFGLILSSLDIRYSVKYTYITAVCLIFILLALNRNPVWKDPSAFDIERITAHKKVAEAFPGHARNYMLLAEVLLDRGSAGEASLYLEKAVSLEPGNAECRKLLVRSYKAQGRLGEAIEQLNLLLKTEPRDRVHTDMAAVLHEMGRKKEGEELLLLAIKENPGGAVQRLNYGSLLLEKGDKEAALKSFMQAAELDPSLFPAFLEAGVLLGERGDFPAAAGMLKRAAEIKPDDAEARLYLGAAYISTGRRAEGVAELKTALRLRPGYPEAAALLFDLR